MYTTVSGLFLDKKRKETNLQKVAFSMLWTLWPFWYGALFKQMKASLLVFLMPDSTSCITSQASGFLSLKKIIYIIIKREEVEEE